MGAATAFPLPEGLAMNEIGGSMIMPVMTDTSLCLSVIAAWKGVEYLMGHSPAFAHLSYETQALQSLRRKLLGQGQAAVTDEAILSAVLLWATATMFAQPDALRRHAAGVQALVAARGGLSTIGRAGSIGQAASIRQLILWADFLTAQFLGEDVLFGELGPTGADDDAPMPPSLAKLSVVAAVPAPFNSLLGPETVKAARDMKLLLVSHDTATRTGRLSIAEYKYLMQLLNKSTIERIGLAYRLRGSHSLDEAVVLAMNLLRLTTLFHAGPLVPIVVAVISRLRKTLAYMTTLESIDTLPPSGGGGITDDSYSSSSSHSSPFPPFPPPPPTQPSSPNYIDLYIWACFVGLVNTFESENRSHFIEMLGTALARRYTYTYRYRGGARDASWPDDWQRDILEMLRSFLWSDAVLTPLFPDACLMIESYLLSPTSSGGVSGGVVIEGWSVPESDKSSRGGKS
ncbi:hypothetical protein AYO20_03339 [Fonsecaea nubica]|uniref:Transcription factor domain-containing protein n=1 Tax=Fonsecaea nubica TaxID=856822 RepID=A0A178D5H2_9EURO|nr:hypothetical protein AYO20_03339 [Fonsecaea nubica]OAL37490.1 hypothetical protein AYO20_03339 [Fonsecaea nubica]